MAERRMFAKTIIDSDLFLEMPLTTQALYFHLSMRADDDGFVNNPKRILRLIGASEDDMKVLLAKSFLIPFENGIVVIKHWKMHNYIQKDRYKPTLYSKEKSTLELTKQGVYEPLDTECIQDVYKMDTQDRLGKDRLELGKVIENTTYSSSTSVDPQPKVTAVEVVNLYHDICKSYPRVRSISDNRRKAINARLRTHSMDEIREVFEKAERSSFLKGSNKRNWSANFDWLMNDTNFCKVLDGNYDDKADVKTEEQPQHREIDWDNLPF